MPLVPNENVLVGFEPSDDAGVYKLTESLALVQTVDFFTPIVDDPCTFGAIAAANSLSDVYAMGGRPISALSILAYPAKGDLEDLKQILKGGAEKMREAGCAVLGGHSIADDEIKFGYAVTGTIDPKRVKPNSGAMAGDALVFEVDCLRFLPGAVAYSRAGAIPGGLKNNRDFASCAVERAREIPEEIENLLYDPQTSGGLLITLPESDAKELVRTLDGAHRIGRVLQRCAMQVRLV